MENNDHNIIEDLQSRLAFQEDLLSSLDTRIAQQEGEIVSLKVQLQHLYSKIKQLDVSGLDDSPEAPPPHY